MNANPPGSDRICALPYAVPEAVADSALRTDAVDAERQGRLQSNQTTVQATAR